MRCISCDQFFDEDIIGFSDTDRKIQIDESGSSEENTYFLCRSADCLNHARKNRLLEKLFPKRKAGTLYVHLAKIIHGDQERLSRLIGLGVRSMRIMTGHAVVRDVIRQRKARLLILDTVERKNTYHKLHQMAEQLNVPILEYTDAVPFEKVVGKANCRCAAVTDSNLAQEILKSRKAEIYADG